MRTFIFAAVAIAALTACESNVDDCLNTETSKIEKTLRSANPAYQAYADIDAFDDRLEGYYRMLHEKQIELDSLVGADGKQCDMKQDSACTKEFEKSHSTLQAHIEKSGFADVHSAIDALWSMQKAAVSADQFEKIIAAGDAAYGSTPEKDDVESWVASELNAYRGERDYHLNQLVYPKLALVAATQATEACSK